MTPFHLAFRVDDIESTRSFYADLLGCDQGRETANWIDFDFFGHQISAHIGLRPASVLLTKVDGVDVPLSHFGAILDWATWEGLRDRVSAAGTPFVITPRVRFQDQPGEQGTFFVADPSGNVLEFKAFRDQAAIFAGARDVDAGGMTA